jgi:type I restriction enzyme S subunit
MQQLLTSQTRLPGFHGEWKLERFGSLVARVFPKSALSSGDGLESGAFPLFVSGGEPKWTESAQFRDAEALVFSDGGVFGVRRAVGCFSVTDHCFVVTLHHERADMRWFEAWFLLHSQQMDRLTFKGSGLRNLDKPSLRDIEIRSPDREEQTAVTAVLSDMDAELATLAARRDKTRDLKQAMMQELLTGKTRLVLSGVVHA